jgi:predicted TIM-barrel fold metal-dependent hydrolase
LLIDTHLHAFTHNLPSTQGARYRPDYDAQFSSLQTLWQAHDVEKGVIVQPSFLGTDNSYLLQLCEQLPQVLRGIAAVSSDISPHALAQMYTQGVRGIRFNWIGVQQWPDVASNAWAHVRRSLQALKMHVQLHVEGARLAQAVACFERWQVPLVIDHLGRPDSTTSWQAHAQLLQQLAMQRGDSKRLHIKLSAPYRCGQSFALLTQHLVRTLDPQHLLWGSDWPFTQHEDSQTYAEQVDAFHTAAPDAKMRGAIMQTAQTLYFS